MIENPAAADRPEVFSSTWVLLARDPGLLEAPALAARAAGDFNFRRDIHLWTDQYSNPFQLIK